MKRFLQRLERFTLRKLVKYLLKKRLSLTQILIGHPMGQSTDYRDSRFPDIVRSFTLRLCTEAINERGVEGAVAELGVYRGEFARQINSQFLLRKLYLFDTFEGFDSQQEQHDADKNLIKVRNKSFPTSIQGVLGKMPNPGVCVVKHGTFPETAHGLEETFAFVSIDADLYQPIYEGLKYFYPRLSKGGYIMVHDFNNQDWLGAHKAVVDYCEQNSISFTPIPDAHGTAVITK